MCFCDSEHNIVIIKGTNDKTSIKDNLDETLTNIINETKVKLSLDIFITVGDTQLSNSNMHVSYTSAIQIQDYMLILPANKITYYNEVIDIHKKSTIKEQLILVHSINKLKEELKKQKIKISSNNEIKDNKMSPIIKQILNYVNLNYNKDLCLKSLGASFNINSAYLGQLFQKEIKESFSEYVTNLRMEKSKELLMTTNLKNSEIATAIGFIDSNYFYRKFKEHFNISPSEFRMSVNQALVIFRQK